MSAQLVSASPLHVQPQHVQAQHVQVQHRPTVQRHVLGRPPAQRVDPDRPAADPGPAAAAITTRVVGHDPLSREGLAGYLHRCAGVDVQPDGAAGPVDVVVVVADRVDVATVRAVRTAHADGAQRVVLVVAEVDAVRAGEVVSAGAVGLIRRADLSRAALAQLVRAVAAGEAVLPPDLLTALLDHPTGHAVRPGAPERSGRRLAVVGLDAREVAVLELLSEGSDTREIAHRLSYSERTVKAVIQDITHRFGLRNRSHAVAYALRQGLI